ncbi:MAG: hypothetical protein JKY43_01110 [Phycisphaerales bacterium]|nr:hypothetical protein [Phycisphaerales bacterium]
MAKNQGLTPDDRVKLKTLDTLLESDVPRSHTIVAALIVKHWCEEHNVFQSQLVMRAERWRRQHIELNQQWRKGQKGIFSDLMRILELPDDIEPGVRASKKRRTKRITQPSLLPKAPSGMITDKEASSFLKMLDEDGISDVFDPGNYIHDNTVFRPPLIFLDGKSIFFDDIWPMYRDGNIKRSWDSQNRSPEIALALDYVLMIIHKEKKWTWQVADRYLVRLPWGHPWKLTHQGRPGWVASLQILSENGMIEKHHGQTWKLRSGGCQIVSGLVCSAWVNF